MINVLNRLVYRHQAKLIAKFIFPSFFDNFNVMQKWNDKNRERLTTTISIAIWVWLCIQNEYDLEGH